jgi:hypothetical protein
MQTRNINKSILITGGDARIDISSTVILLFLIAGKNHLVCGKPLLYPFLKKMLGVITLHSSKIDNLA